MLIKSRRRSVRSIASRVLITFFCVTASTAVIAQNDTSFEDDFEDDFEETAEKKPEVAKEATETGGDLEAGKTSEEKVTEAKEKDENSSKKKQLVPDFDDSGFVDALDRTPPKDLPLILGKKYSMANRFEFGVTYVHSYADRLLHHSGVNLSASYHLFDWLAFEGFATGFYPDELGVMNDVRQRGHSIKEKGLPVALSGLWQTFATGGVGAEWSPLYGKLSFLSEFDVNFQFYLFGGAAASGIAKVSGVQNGATVNNNTGFYPGLMSNQAFDYSLRIDAVYGAGLRVYPIDWMAVRFDLRNLTGLNPSVEEATYNDKYDINNMPMLQIGLSFLL